MRVNGTRGYSFDGGNATVASLSAPTGLAVDRDGNLYIADTGNNRVRKVSPNGVITTFAGTGNRSFSGDGGPATEAALSAPANVVVDGAGNLYIVDAGNFRIREVTPDNVIHTVGGNGVYGSSGDGGPAVSAEFQFEEAGGLAVDQAGNLYVADAGTSKIRKIGTDGIVTAFALGAGNETALAIDSSGNLYLTNGTIRMITPSGVGTVLAAGGRGPSGDGGPAFSAEIGTPNGIAVAANGSVYFSDEQNSLVRVLVPPTAPFFSVVVTHTVNLYRGQSNATYSVTVANASPNAQLTGEVTVAFEPPAGFQLVSASGTGWNCADACTRADPLSALSAYPPIVVVFRIGSTALSQASFAAIATGSGAALTRGVNLDNVYDSQSVAAPVLISPSNDAGHVLPNVTLSWTGSTNSHYDVYLGANPTPPLVATVSGPAFIPTGLVNGSEYYWRVVASNAIGAASSKLAAFATGLDVQTISFAPIPGHVVGDAPFALSGSSNIQAPIVFSVLSGPATINGGVVTITGAGQVTIEAAASGTSTYAAAAAIQSFTVGEPSIALGAAVNAASFVAGVLAPDSLDSLFGQNLCDTAPIAPCSLSVIDSGGQASAAMLLYASPTQINFVLPAGGAAGNATLAFTNTSEQTGTLPIQIAATNPGLFSVEASGNGPALGSVLHVGTDGNTVYSALSDCVESPPSCTAIPITFDSPTDRVFLVLYGTGIRGVQSLSDVAVQLANTPLPALYAGPQTQFEGLDQVNVEIPRRLIGVGATSLQVLVNGQKTNALTVNVQ